MEFRLNFPWLKRFLLVFCIFLISSNSYAQAGSLYRKAVDSVKAGSLAHAFMYFKILAEEYPRSPLYSRALFAIGEYYFSISDYSRALDSFSEFIESCPDDKAVSFALAYMLNIAQKRGTKPLVESIKGKIVSSEQITLLFRDYKEIKYYSPFRKRYRALYYIDRIEFYINEELFGKVAF